MMATPYETVYAWYKGGTLPFKVVNRGRNLKVSRSAVHAFLADAQKLVNMPGRKGLEVAFKVAENIALREKGEEG